MICSSRLNTSGVLFDFVKQHHRVGPTARLLSAVPLLSNHIAGREPTNLEMVWRSMYSDISNHGFFRRSKNASDLASSVLPTPVGPEKIKLAMGRLGLLMPTRARRIARKSLDGLFLTNQPLVEVSSIFSSFCDSDSVSLFTAPVQEATMWAMSDSLTTGASLIAALQSVLPGASADLCLIPISRHTPARSNSCKRTTSSLPLDLTQFSSQLLRCRWHN